MAYSLDTALTELKRSQLWNERAVVREPLEGLADGDNKVFYTAHAPIASLTLYDATGAVFSSGSYSVESEEAGTILFNDPPASTYYASYTVQALTDAQLTDVLKDAFDEMERRYTREWHLVQSDSTWYISSDADTVTDPVCSDLTFSTARVQVKLFLLCAEYTLVKALMKHAAANYFRYRESRAGGLQIDRSGNAAALEAVKDELNDDIEDCVIACAYQAGDADAFGQYVPGTKSDVWYEQYDWWRHSRQYRGEIA